jgi:hypothetical protein
MSTIISSGDGRILAVVRPKIKRLNRIYRITGLDVEDMKEAQIILTILDIL